jgi:prolyl-tRNA synthetase
MLQSKLFGKTQRDNPKDEVSINAQFLIRAGFIDKMSAGVYSYLPLGLRVFRKIQQIIREEMEAINGQEIFLPVLMPRELWEKTDRWSTFGEALFKIKDHSDRDFVLGPTHEEAISDLANKNILTYKDLPMAIFQIQDKFRDEPRAKSGLVRGKEFMMKDLYSFHADEQSLDTYYEEAKKAYSKLFGRCGLKTFAVEASGGVITKGESHEYMVKSLAGEDTIILCELCGWAQNKEIAQVQAKKPCPKCGGILKEEKAMEVGHVFKLGIRYSKDLNVYFTDKNGEKKLVIMGCYGIGVSRIMGTVVEVFHDDKGMIWPQSVAPFLIHLIELSSPDIKKNEKINKTANKIYGTLLKDKIEVLYDDRMEKTAGEKFADSDLIGIPYRILISEKTLSRDEVEIKKRGTDKLQFIKIKELAKFIKDIK